MNGFRFSRRGCSRCLAGAFSVLGVASITPPALAEEPVRPTSPSAAEAPAVPDTAAAFVAGASVFVLGMGVGASLIGSNSGRTPDIAGWMVMQTSFAASPIVAHGVAGEWGRGLLFGSVPLATTAGTATVLAVDPNAVRHSALPEQRILWSLFVVGLFSSVYGVVDATWADERASRVAVTPMIGPRIAGLAVGGNL